MPFSLNKLLNYNKLLVIRITIQGNITHTKHLTLPFVFHSMNHPPFPLPVTSFDHFTVKGTIYTEERLLN